MAINKLEKNQMISLVCEVSAKWTALMVDRNLIPIMCVTTRNVDVGSKSSDFAIEVLAGRGIDPAFIDLVIDRLNDIKKRGATEHIHLK